jgi:purine-binding chemotaxis protein CheW
MTAAGGREHFAYADRGLQFALPVVDVQEIIDLPTLLPPHAGVRGCVGNVLHRDFLVPVIDSAMLGADLPPTGQAPRTAIIVEHAGALFGLTIERHVAVVAFSGGTAEPPADATGVTAAANRFVAATRAFRGDLLIVFAIATLATTIRATVGNQRVVDEQQADDDRVVASGDQQRDFLCVELGGIAIAIPVASVLEVVEGHDVTPLFRVHPSLRGLINLRGRVLACLDISAELDLPPRVLEERNQFVVVHSDDAELALCVDRIGGIRPMQLDHMESADAALGGDLKRYFDGVLEGDGGPVLFLAVAALFDSPHLQPYRSHDG